MAQVSNSKEINRRTYGNWRRPVAAGLGAFSAAATGVIFAGMIIGILAHVAGGFRASVPTAITVLLVLAPLAIKDKHGLTLGQKGVVFVGYFFNKQMKQTLYRSGPLGQVPYGTNQLPGLGASMQLMQAYDAYNRPFALIYTPSQASYTVVVEAQPDGESLVDQEQIDIWVAHWGQWLALLGNEAGVEAASVTVETAPDTGHRLMQEVAARSDVNAPRFAREVLDQIVMTYPSGSATVRAWVAVTFSASSHAGGRKKKPDEMAREIGTLLPGLTENLQATGAGACRPMPSEDLCEVVRTAYDPAVSDTFDAARLEDPDDSTGGNELRWSDVGPAAAEAFWDYYVHDSGVSCSWVMTVAPRGIVQSSILSRLLAPHSDVARKRITLYYRPIDAGIAAGIVETDRRNADSRVASQPKPSSRLMVDQKAAAATANEEASGAGLVNFGMVVTATVLDKEDLNDAKATLDTLAGSARLLLRPAYGSQDVAFAASLPLGLILPKHLRTPASIRSGL